MSLNCGQANFHATMHRVSQILNHVVPTTTTSVSPLNASGIQNSSELIKDEVVIVSAVRTPIGSFNGSLSPLTCVQLGTVAVKESIKRANINVKDIGCVYLGNVLQANEGQAPARQVALAAGVPITVPCTTVNKVCASGLKSIMLAASEIKLGTAKVAIAGGMESMSNVPYYLPKARQGLRMGNQQVIDGMMHDGLHDPYGDYAMGVVAEKCAETQNISRADQDAHAFSSYTRAANSWKEKKFSDEIVPVSVPQRGKSPKMVSEDEEYKRVNLELLSKLPGVFGRGKTVTAANASSISDGAAALVLTSASYAREHGLKPIAIIRSWADAALSPDQFTIAPSVAIPLAASRAGLTTNEIDFYEINEAFSVVAEANCRLLNLPKSKVNVNGGAVSLGHPIGCSGARILVTLISVLSQNSARFGCAAICNGGGGASALVIERV